MYVGTITTPTWNQVNTCATITSANILAIPAACHTWTFGYWNAAKTVVTEVATKFAGTRKAQMLMQLAREKLAMVLKSNISLLGIESKAIFKSY